MSKRPLSVTINLSFILLNALIWLVLGILIAIHAHPALPDQPLVKVIMSILSFFIATITVCLYYMLKKQIRFGYYLTLAFFVGVSLLTVFDEFGISDLIVLIINLIPIVLLIKDRAWYLQKDTHVEAST
jgi:hypothetical protein